MLLPPRTSCSTRALPSWIRSYLRQWDRLTKGLQQANEELAERTRQNTTLSTEVQTLKKAAGEQGARWESDRRELNAKIGDMQRKLEVAETKANGILSAQKDQDSAAQDRGNTAFYQRGG